MKKIVCCMLALMLLFSTCAVATVVPSKTTSDMIWFETSKEENAAEDGPVFRPSLEEEQEKVEVAEKELNKLIVSETVEGYFGVVVDVENNELSLHEVMDIQEGEALVVHEFTAITVAGYTEEQEEVPLKLHFPSAFQVGQKVLVLFGVETDELDANNEKIIRWIAVEGVGVADETGEVVIELVVSGKMMLSMQARNAMIAIVSK